MRSGAAARPRLILASRSPQRRAILDQLGVAYEVHATDAPELTAGPPEEVVLENAYRKAHAAAEQRDAREEVPVLGVDTIVTLGPRIFGKPADPDAARATLTALQGRDHTVLSGVCLIHDAQTRTAAARTVVRFRALSAAQVEAYVETGEWRERAGGYAIQERGALLVTGIEGDYLNVVGLPVATLADLAPWLLDG